VSDFGLILDHPDNEEIVSKLLTGTSPKEVGQWLKLKYPKKNQSHLRLTIKLLKEFSESEYTDCHKQFSKDLMLHKSGGKIDKRVYESLLDNRSYRERLSEVADTELDIGKMLTSLVTVCQNRAEQVFDIIQEDPHNFSGDSVLIKYMNELINMAEKFDKLVNRAPDQIIQHNVTIQTVEAITVMFQDAIRETLAQVDPERSSLFMEIFSQKMAELKPPEELPQEERLKEAKVLQEKVLDTSD
jgi:hypothetical protein